LYLTITNRTSFEKVYRTKKDAKTKERKGKEGNERMLLVLSVVYYGKMAAQVSRDSQQK
jgi:hypothetical protein